LYIYNVTTQVKEYIKVEWLEWMRNDFIPEMIATELFSHYRIVKILDIDESDGPTYAIQYFTDNRAKYDQFVQIYSDKLSQKAIEKWKDKIFSFRSLMEVI
jgi:hypothetical protein